MSALIRVAVSAQSMQLQPGEWADITLTVQNFGEIVDRYRITVEGIDPSWVNISRPELALFPKDQDQVRITLTAPAGAAARAGRYALSIQVASLEQPSERSAVPFTLEVPVLTTLDLLLRPQRQRSAREATFTVQATNRGNAELTVLFEGSDAEEALLYAFDPPRLILPAGQERSVQLRVRSKALAHQREGRVFPFCITARLSEGPGEARQLQGEWEFAPPAFEVALRPQKGRGVAQGRFAVLLTNPGTGDLHLQLQGSDPEEACQLAFETADVVVPAGQERAVQLTVRPRLPLQREETSRSHAFTVTARTADAPQMARQAQGEWVQVPPAFDIAMRPERASGVAEGAFALQITNQGGDDLELQFEGSDLQQACLCLFEPAQVTVPGGQQAEVRLRVQPKTLLAQKEARRHTFTVTARPPAAPRHVRQLQGEYEQTPATLALELRPAQVHSHSEGLFALQVGNPANTNLTARFEALDPMQTCQFKFVPPGLVIPAGQERQVQLHVHCRERVPPGQVRVRPFTVVARPLEAPTLMQQVQGQWVQLPRPASFLEMIGPFLLISLGWGIAWLLGVLLKALLMAALRDPLGMWIGPLTGDLDLTGRILDRLIGGAVLGLLVGLLGGLFTGLGGFWAAKAGRSRQLVLTFVVWALLWLLGESIAGVLALLAFDPFGLVLSALVYGLVLGFLGGWASGGALRDALPGIKSGLVGLGWAAGFGLAEALAVWWAPALHDWLRPLFGYGPPGEPVPGLTALLLGLMGLVAGTGGGLVMLWRVVAARKATGAASATPAWPPPAVPAAVPPAAAVPPLRPVAQPVAVPHAPPAVPTAVPPAPAVPAAAPPAAAAVPPAAVPVPPTRSWERKWARLQGPVADTAPPGGPLPVATAALPRAGLETPSGLVYALEQLGKADLLIGRYDPQSHSTPDIDLQSETNGMTVSRRHAWLHFREGGWQVEAISGSSPTRLGSRTLAVGEVQPLAPGDVLVLGSVSLRFR